MQSYCSWCSYLEIKINSSIFFFSTAWLFRWPMSSLQKYACRNPFDIICREDVLIVSIYWPPHPHHAEPHPPAHAHLHGFRCNCLAHQQQRTNEVAVRDKLSGEDGGESRGWSFSSSRPHRHPLKKRSKTRTCSLKKESMEDTATKSSLIFLSF